MQAVPVVNVPSARQPPPNSVFRCIARKLGSIGPASIWFISQLRHSRVPRRPTYPMLVTYPRAISRWIVKFHICTVGSRRFWSNTRAVAAVFCSEIGGVNWLDGFAVGGVNSFGNWLSRTSGAVAQPAVVARVAATAVHR